MLYPEGSMRDIHNLRTSVKNLNLHHEKPGGLESLGRYFRAMAYTWVLMFREKELFLFTLLQWMSVAIAYYLFVMMLYWIPPEVWKSTESSDDGSIADIILFAWVIVCVGVAAFPLGIFSSCMAVVHMLDYYEEKPSTIAACLKIVLPRAWRLWIFHWWDGYYTVMQIVERLPKKNDRTSPSERVTSELTYYIWKIATMAVLPNLITGRSFKETCINTLDQIKEWHWQMMMVRFGYSIMCWIVAIATYAFVFLNMDWLRTHIAPGELHNTIATIYLYVGLPILACVAVVQLFLRPAYVIALTDIYGSYIQNKNEHLIADEPPAAATSAIVAFFFLCAIIGTVYLYREPLGIMDMLATPYGQKYFPH